MSMRSKCSPVQLIHGHEGIDVIGVLRKKGCYVVGVIRCLTFLEQRLDSLHSHPDPL